MGTGDSNCQHPTGKFAVRSCRAQIQPPVALRPVSGPNCSCRDRDDSGLRTTDRCFSTHRTAVPPEREVESLLGENPPALSPRFGVDAASLLSVARRDGDPRPATFSSARRRTVQNCVWVDLYSEKLYDVYGCTVVGIMLIWGTDRHKTHVARVNLWISEI